MWLFQIIRSFSVLGLLFFCDHAFGYGGVQKISEGFSRIFKQKVEVSASQSFVETCHGSFDPLLSPLPIKNVASRQQLRHKRLQVNRSPLIDLRGNSNRRQLYLVQANEAVAQQHATALAEKQLQIIGYLPKDTYMVAALSQHLDNVQQLAWVRSVSPLHPMLKLHPQLLDTSTGLYQIKHFVQQQHFWLETLPDLDLFSTQQLSQQIAFFNGQVLQQTASLWHVLLSAEALRYLVDVPEIIWIEPVAALPASPASSTSSTLPISLPKEVVVAPEGIVALFPELPVPFQKKLVGPLQKFLSEFPEAFLSAAPLLEDGSTLPPTCVNGPHYDLPARFVDRHTSQEMTADLVSFSEETTQRCGPAWAKNVLKIKQTTHGTQQVDEKYTSNIRFAPDHFQMEIHSTVSLQQLQQQVVIIEPPAQQPPLNELAVIWQHVALLAQAQPVSAIDHQVLTHIAPVGLSTHEVFETSIEVMRDGPLKVLLVWPDREALPLAHDSLVNDLDLEIIHRDKNYHANAFYDGDIQHQGSADHRHTQEIIYLEKATQGTYTLLVKAKQVPLGKQRFILMVLGDVKAS